MCERSTLNAVTKVWTGSDCETAERLLGLGAGGGAEWPGQSGLDRAGEAMASAELQGKYQKLAQEYSKVPVVCGE